MKSIAIIAGNTYREIIRDRILYGLVIFALLLIGISIALGQLTFAEQSRISANFGFSAMHLSAVVLAIFIGSTLVSREIEKRTILTLLSRSITRNEFLVGKFLGLMGVITTVLIGLSLILMFVLFQVGMGWNTGCNYAFLGIVLESLILLSMVMMFGTFTKPIMTVMFTLGVFLIGHWVGSLQFFADSSDSQFFKLFASLLNAGLPDLERLNWRSLPIYDDSLKSDEFLSALIYSVSWVFVLLGITALNFRRRDFV